jgi:3D-(3,5/4)-trihydroxycyclohexane-1,2-dione acylhydrolase (decyclizing)
LDAAKHSGVMLLADARTGLVSLTGALEGYRVDDAYTREHRTRFDDWNKVVEGAYHLDHRPLPAQTEVIGALNETIGANAVVVQAAGSLPGDLQMLWRAQDAKQYHVEYAYSCMGYEIAGALGIKMAAPDREVYSLVGDGSYLMMAQEIVTAVSEGIKLIIVIIQNHGFSSIGALSESLGSQRFGTSYRYRDPETGLIDGGTLPVDLAKNAESLGADVIRVKTIEEFRTALDQARAATRLTAVHIETDMLAPVPSSDSWWDVPVSEVAQLDSTQQARKVYEAHKAEQRDFLAPVKKDSR